MNYGNINNITRAPACHWDTAEVPGAGVVLSLDINVISAVSGAPGDLIWSEKRIIPDHTQHGP